MLTLPAVFSSHALFQQNSVLTIHGKTDADSVTVRLISSDTIISEISVTSEEGRFTVSLNTPLASFRPYNMELVAGNDQLVLTDILFGELWLASGQSNMSFQNSSMPDCDAFLDTIKDVPVRIYHVDNPQGGNAAQFPRNPSDEASGRWSDMSDRSFLLKVSAIGTAFIKELSHYFRARIPVGFLDASWGGTPIIGWIPECALTDDQALLEKVKSSGRYPVDENWNKHGGLNFQQPFAMYNCKIAPLYGVRVKGVIWYQGENDCWREFTARIYAQYLRCYHKFYAQHFAATPESFMMISSLLYPWTYGNSGETNRGILNKAFIDTALAEPHKFSFTPITDLSPIWAYHQLNHPIHPANKYDVGYRLALLAETNSYGRGSQRMPATLESCEVCNGFLRLRFRHASSGLRVVGPKVRGLYIAGDDGVYLTADCRIPAPDTLEVFHPFLSAPKQVAYDYSSMEEGVNLFAGEFPVAPFATDTEHKITIESKPWTDLNRDALWCVDEGPANFYHPIWRPMENTEICFDSAFTKGTRSLRVISEGTGTCGVTVISRKYNRLDFDNYSGMRLDLFNCRGLHAALSLKFRGDESPVILPLKSIEKLWGGWETYEVAFTDLPDKEIVSMSFIFAHKDNPRRFVNMENFVLIPKAAVTKH